MKRYGSLAAALAFPWALACGGPEGKPATGEPTSRGSDVLATVNGQPLTMADVRQRLKTESHQTQIAPEHVPNVLEPIVQQEVLAQRARAEGLALEGPALARVEEKEAELRALVRKELADLYFRKKVTLAATPGEDEVRAYYQTHQTRIQTELRILQILEKSEADIEAVAQRLKAGETFEAVATSRGPAVHAGAPPPWDLGFLNWKQLPEPWLAALDGLADGAVTGVIRGPKDRYWILKVTGRRPHPGADYEVVKPAITELLRATKIEREGEALRAAARSEAKVEYLKAGSPSSAP